MAIEKLTTAEVKMWQERIKKSLEWRKPWEVKWERYIDYLQNKFLNVAQEDDFIGVNLVHPMVRVIIPGIYSKNPDVVVIPRRKEFKATAALMQLLIRYLLKELDVKKEVKLAILDAILIGHAWIKTGFATQFEVIEKEQEAKQTLIQFAMTLTGIKPPDDYGDLQEENRQSYAAAPNEKIVGERPWALRSSPFDMVVPAYTRRPEEMPWIAERIIFAMEDVFSNPNLDVPAGIKPSMDIEQLLKARGQRGTSGITQTDPTTDKDLNYKIFYEVWDLRASCVHMIADDADDHCYSSKENEYGFLESRHPWVTLRFNEVPDQFYPMSDVEPWEAQIDELNKTRSQMMNHRKRYNRRYLYREGAITEENLKKLEAGEDGTLIPVEDDDKTLDNIILPVKDAPLPAEVYGIERLIKQDITEISGVTGYQKGNVAAGAKTATEAAIVESQSRSRNEERLDVVSDFANRIAKNLGHICQKFMTREMVFPIVGGDAIDWIEIKSEKDIQGDFLYDTIYGSSLTINPDVDRQQFIEFYKMTANDPYYDQVKIRLELNRKFRLVGPEDYLNAQIAPQLMAKRVQDAMMAQTEADKTIPDQPDGDGAVPDSGSLKDGINSQVAVPTPGGIGGGALASV